MIKYFTLKELTSTNTGKDNTIRQFRHFANLRKLGEFLDIIREELGLPIHVNSGFRTVAVNKAVKGAPMSAHLEGSAVDIRCSDNEKLLKILRKYIESIDQLIVYRNGQDISFIHVGLPFPRAQYIESKL